MGAILNNEILKVNLGLFVVGTLLMTLMGKLRKVFGKNKKAAILYGLFVLLTFGLTGLLSSSRVLNDTPMNSFIGFQLVFFLLGLLHIYVMYTWFPDLSEDESQFFPQCLFTLAYTCLGLIVFLQVVDKFRSPFNYVFMTSALWFIIPILFLKLYHFATQIALPVYDSWLFPLGKEIKDAGKNEWADPKVIAFEFKKRENEDHITNFRIKAPQGMEFGKLFYYFIIDYNERHPEGKIEILDEKTQRPSSWVFHFKPHWYSPVRHIDFNRTVAFNNIGENSVIMCSRVVIE